MTAPAEPAPTTIVRMRERSTISWVRWLFHIVTSAAWNVFHAEGGDHYAPPSMAHEGFVHASYRDKVVESARLYFPAGADLVVLRIDPRKLEIGVEEAATPRGPMPHIRGPIPRAAVCAVLSLADIPREPDHLDPRGSTT